MPDLILKGIETGSKAVQGVAAEAAKAVEGAATQASKALPKVASNTLKVLGTLGTLVTPSGPIGDASDEITGPRVFEYEKNKVKNREEGWASVKFQLQQGKNDYFWDTVRVNPERPGVLKRQGFNALDQLEYDVKNKHNLHKPLPKGFHKSEKFKQAIEKMRGKISRSPMPKSVNKTNLQETFDFKGKEYRIDVENLSGQNNFVNY
ncbi:hypothetical protein V6Z05_01300 [Leptospira venezuelensis]|uniref:hypothetical protein n=1 Tax=Leptospira venezuelensis TaxID=1958811 RepID=UPI0012FFAFC0|nr:hypothetical protein [Leptospira venezuelensis]